MNPSVTLSVSTNNRPLLSFFGVTNGLLATFPLSSLFLLDCFPLTQKIGLGCSAFLLLLGKEPKTWVIRITAGEPSDQYNFRRTNAENYLKKRFMEMVIHRFGAPLTNSSMEFLWAMMFPDDENS